MVWLVEKVRVAAIYGILKEATSVARLSAFQRQIEVRMVAAQAHAAIGGRSAAAILVVPYAKCLCVRSRCRFHVALFEQTQPGTS